jgi:hypothetical protein
MVTSRCAVSCIPQCASISQSFAWCAVRHVRCPVNSVQTALICFSRPSAALSCEHMDRSGSQYNCICRRFSLVSSWLLYSYGASVLPAAYCTQCLAASQACRQIILLIELHEQRAESGAPIHVGLTQLQSQLPALHRLTLYRATNLFKCCTTQQRHKLAQAGMLQLQL